MKKRISRKESQDMTKKLIIQCAYQDIVKYGFEGSSVDRITLKAGFSRGAFYSNFKSKDHLFLSVMEFIMEQILNDLEKINESISPGEYLESMKSYYVEKSNEKNLNIIMTEFLLAGFRNKSISKDIAKLNHKYISAIAEFIKLGLEKNKKTASRDYFKLATMLLGMGHGVRLYQLADKDNFTEAYVENILETNFENLIK